MAAGPSERITITAELFLEPLSLSALPGALPERNLELFAAVVEDLQERGLADEIAIESQTAGTPELSLMIPGTPVHVHLTAIGDPQINQMLAVVAALEIHHLQGVVITLAGLRRLTQVFSLLRTQYGERSIVEALKEARPSTAEAIAGVLHGAYCRHPTAKCRFMGADGSCEISIDAVAETLRDLARRQVLITQNATEPHEYKVAI